MKFLCAVTVAENAIRKLHRQLDQTEIIVCGEFIIHVKHDYALSPSAETFVSYLRRLEWELAQSALQSSLKKLADAKLNATWLCLRTMSRARFTAHCFQYTPYYFALPLLLFHYFPCSPFHLLSLSFPFQFHIISKFLERAASSNGAKEKRHYTTRFVKAHGRE